MWVCPVSEFLCPKKNKIAIGLCWLRNMIRQMFFNTQILSSTCSFKCLVLLCNYSGKGIFGNKKWNSCPLVCTLFLVQRVVKEKLLKTQSVDTPKNHSHNWEFWHKRNLSNSLTTLRHSKTVSSLCGSRLSPFSFFSLMLIYFTKGQIECFYFWSLR